MSRDPAAIPPKIARALLALSLPPADRRYALADLEEEFEARVARVGAGGARRWYRGQVLKSVLPALLGRVRRGWRPRNTTRALRPDRGGGWRMSAQNFTSDVRYAVRMLARSPLTVLVTVLSLGLGLGAVATVFTVADGVLHPPAPWLRDPGRLVTLYTSDEDGGAYGSTSLADFEDLRSANALEGVAAATVKLLSLDEGGDTRPLLAEVVSGNYLGLTGIRPILGRAFAPDEGAIDSDASVGVIAFGLWKDRFGGDPRRPRRRGPCGPRLDAGGHRSAPRDRHAREPGAGAPGGAHRPDGLAPAGVGGR